MLTGIEQKINAVGEGLGEFAHSFGLDDVMEKMQERYAATRAALYAQSPFPGLKYPQEMMETPHQHLRERIEWVVDNNIVVDSHVTSNLVHTLLYELGIPVEHLHLRDEYMLAPGTTPSLVDWLRHVYKKFKQTQADYVVFASGYSRFNGDELEALVEQLPPGRSTNVLKGKRVTDSRPRWDHLWSKNPELGYPYKFGLTLISFKTFATMISLKPLREEFLSSDEHWELFKTLKERANIEITNEETFCLQSDSLEEGEECVAWTTTDQLAPILDENQIDRTLKLQFEVESGRISEDEAEKEIPFLEPHHLIVAVRTSPNAPPERIEWLVQLWASENKKLNNIYDIVDKDLDNVHVVVYADEEDVSRDIKKLERKGPSGGCSDIMNLIKQLSRDFGNYNYFLLVDDETLVSTSALVELVTQIRQPAYPVMKHMYEKFRLPSRDTDPGYVYLAQLLHEKFGGTVYSSRFDSKPVLTPLYLGYRHYHQGINEDMSYPFISGNGGILLDAVALDKLAVCGDCVCGSPGHPADMSIGYFMQHLGVFALHHPSFYPASIDEWPPNDRVMHPVTLHGLSPTLEATEKLFDTWLSRAEWLSVFDDWRHEDWNKLEVLSTRFSSKDLLHEPVTWLNRGQEILTLAQEWGYEDEGVFAGGARAPEAESGTESGAEYEAEYAAEDEAEYAAGDEAGYEAEYGAEYGAESGAGYGVEGEAEYEAEYEVEAEPGEQAPGGKGVETSHSGKVPGAEFMGTPKFKSAEEFLEALQRLVEPELSTGIPSEEESEKNPQEFVSSSKSSTSWIQNTAEEL